ncbi:MAG TPA: thioredoxin domain-containing protein [Micavibrio sp.]
MYLKILAVLIILVGALVGWRYFGKTTAPAELQRAPHHQYVGAENPALIITEIMDYRCPYCRAMHDSMSAFVQLHPEVRVIYRVYPIFKGPSIFEAKMAMAAGKQGRFEEMHNILIRREEPVSIEEKDRIVKELGLDAARFDQDMFSWAATKDLMAASSAVEGLGIKGTPTFVVNGNVHHLSETLPTVEDLEAMFAPYLNQVNP